MRAVIDGVGVVSGDVLLVPQRGMLKSSGCLTLMHTQTMPQLSSTCAYEQR